MYQNILIPIAFDAEYDTAGPLKLAGLLANPDARITLLHVMEQIPSYAISYLPADYQAKTHEAVEAQLQEMAGDLPNARGLVIRGHSGRSILNWAEENKADLIIVASHKPGMQDLLIGSTATYVVRHAQCAVHVIR